MIGSPDIYAGAGRRPWASVNFLTAHDGFTMMDLVSYNEPHNEANQEQSGESHNRSWNCGEEGPTKSPETNKLRQRQLRNLLCSLVFSQGVPMLLAGDEMGNSQHGNNNAYCQDDEISWIDWNLDDSKKSLLDFTRLIISLRKKHPALHRAHFFHDKFGEDGTLPEVAWLSINGEVMGEEEWKAPDARVLGMYFSGDEDTVFLLVLYAHHEDATFKMPPDHYARSWKRLIDTSHQQIEASKTYAPGDEYPLTSRSLVLFEAQKI